MFNHRQIRSNISGRSAWMFSVAVPLAAAFTVAFSASTARAQECENDADCGFGFRCEQEVVSTTSSSGGFSVTGGGTTTTVGGTGGPIEAVCGNSWCEETEDPESCSDDCGITSYCVGVSCESDSQCAEGYSCLPEHGVYSTTTTGSDGPVCGDRSCDEGEEACDTDCSTELTCQVSRCQTDADCDEGYYCDPRGGSAVSSASTSGGGTDGSSYTLELYLSECLPVSTDGGGGSGGSGEASSAESGSSVQSVSTVGGTASTGAGVGGNHGNDGGSGHHGPHWPHKPLPGCAVAAPLPGGSPFFAALASLLACGVVLRRRRND